MKRLTWRIFPLVMFGVLFSFLWKGLSLDPHQLPATTIGKPLPSFDLPSLLGPDRTRFTSNMLEGQVSLLIVWASWCFACQTEQVFLFDLAQQGIVLYGLNYKDDPESAKHWLVEWGNPYKAIGADMEGKLAIDLGVYGAPETYLIDQRGVIQYRYPGILNAAVWQREFLPRLLTLKGRV